MEEMTDQLAIAEAKQSRTLSRSIARGLVAAFAIVLGLSIVYSVGFSANDFLHGAVHDVRHTSGFPCH
ncbi:MAG TPA: CbtB domain-containing protein [Candidatus Binataceae bacterium]|nr:CbtB domain-containing protein [Candidatus Binataceae bacterium]